MSGDLFTGRSEIVTDDESSSLPIGPRGGKGKASGSGGGVYRESNKGAELKGRKPKGYDPRKYGYDVVRGMGKNVGFTATKDDRMSASQAGLALANLHVKFGIDREDEGILSAFDRAMFFCHTINGASVLTPGRSAIKVDGMQEISFGDVRDILGVDQRRFFRAFADDITSVNRAVLAEYDPEDFTKAEHWGWLMQVAAERGLSRYPHLAHDSADACMEISPTERAALSASKSMVISTTGNTADKMKANNRVQSADGYEGMGV